MNCEDVQGREIVEKYITGQLGDADAEAFEAHYFECAKCFEELQTLQALSAVLQRRRKTARRLPAARWLAAAMVLAVLGATWWVRHSGSLRKAERAARAESPARGVGTRADELALLARPRRGWWR
ncbi:MAG: hypothetical protein ACLQGV_01255 [Bryobacteraceae bacterium]